MIYMYKHVVYMYKYYVVNMYLQKNALVTKPNEKQQAKPQKAQAPMRANLAEQRLLHQLKRWST